MFDHSSRKEVITKIKSDIKPNILMSAKLVRNTHLWMLLKNPDSNRIYIYLCLLKESNGKWGYKGLDEAEGLPVYDCPNSLLLAASKPITIESKAWRKDAKNKTKVTRPEYEKNQIWSVYGNQYKLIKKITEGRQGWMAKNLQSGEVQRIPLIYLLHGAFVS
ncbi:hypothetical protein A3715_13990 [Oleiphilus sp. HI0009]|nr:hypothetical protein A3715_13990 [Oleiphilus sp. HI0009]